MLPSCTHSQVESVVLTLLLPPSSLAMILCTGEERSLMGNESHLWHTSSSVPGYSCSSVIPRQNAKGIPFPHGRTPGISFRHCLWITLETESHAVILTLMQNLQIHWETLSVSHLCGDAKRYLSLSLSSCH